MIYLIDSNVLLDVLTENPVWFEWSASRLAQCAEDGILVINAIIYGEVSIGFDKIEDLEATPPPNILRRDAIRWSAAFLAGKCFLQYRRRRGTRTTPLPDFFIGAHAAIAGHTLVTRDARGTGPTSQNSPFSVLNHETDSDKSFWVSPRSAQPAVFES